MGGVIQRMYMYTRKISRPTSDSKYTTKMQINLHKRYSTSSSDLKVIEKEEREREFFYLRFAPRAIRFVEILRLSSLRLRSYRY